MVASEGGPTNPLFVRELQRALQHLYDPAGLRRSPLVELLAPGREDPTAALQRLLLEAIEALRPSASVPPQANAWRVYHILNQRYGGQFPQRDIALNLAVSMRQLRRLHPLALQALADYLWDRYGLAGRFGPPAASQEAPGPAQPAAGMPTREQELEWLKASLPSEAVDIGKVIETVLAITRPLIEAAGVQVTCTGTGGSPRLAAQLPPVRHSLLNILTAAIDCVPGGRLEIATVPRPGQVLVSIGPRANPQAAPRTPSALDLEKLESARELLRLCGGSLEFTLGKGGPGPFSARLVLPTAEQVTVLVVDDNADALRLMEHYLAGSRYRFAGLRDPRLAVATAEEATPQIIVLDLMLPGVDGWELLGRLREHPATRRLPVIVCSILPQEDLALALGAAALIRKPFSQETLLAALDRQLGLPSPGCG